MVEFDTSKRENRWIEVVAVRWGNKLGRRCLALLNIKMYYACSLAKRKRDAPTYEDSFSSIVVDENNAVKANSKLLKLFIFFWDLNLDAATEERIDKSTAFTEAEENKFRYSFIDVAPASTAQHAMEVLAPLSANCPRARSSKMDHSLYHVTHQAASILIKCTNLLVKNISTKPNEKLKSQQTWGIFVILHQSYFLQR
jgi:hypothetical protein